MAKGKQRETHSWTDAKIGGLEVFNAITRIRRM